MRQDLLQQLVDLDGRVVVVSGAGGGGMGTAITRLAAAAGAQVVAVDRSPESLEKHVAPLIAEGLPIAPVIADVGSDAGVAAMMAAVRKAPGQLHGLVTIIGGAQRPHWGATTGISRQSWDDLLSWNLDTMFFVTQAVAAELKAQGRPGSLVAISSISGLAAAPFHVGYGAAKAAILSVVRTLGVELARDGIRVNAIAPGAVRTPAAEVGPEPERDRRAIPMARQATPDEIAKPALFLLSDMSSYMTGQCLTVDGGVSNKWSHLDDENCPALVKDRWFLAAQKA